MMLGSTLKVTGKHNDAMQVKIRKKHDLNEVREATSC